MSETHEAEMIPALPVPLVTFTKSLVGGPDEVWTRLLVIRHGRENHTMAEWHAALDALRSEPVT